MMINHSITYRISRGILLCICVICLFILQGCSPVQVIVEKLVDGDMAGATTSCVVDSVEGTTGNHEYVCQNSFGTYIYHNESIYNYDDMEELVKVKNLEYMACNEDVLYYSEATDGGQLYCYNFADGTSILVMDEYRVVGMKSYEDDIFMLQRTKEGIEYGITGKIAMEYPYELMYYHKAEEGTSVSRWAEGQEAVSATDDYKVYDFEGYKIIEDLTIQEALPQLVYVEHEEDFQYSCYAYHTYGRIGDEYICLTRDAKYRYKGQETEISEILSVCDEYAITAFPGLSASQIGFLDDEVYMLVQYGKGTSEYQENPSNGLKVCDVLFKLSPETGECERIYEVGKQEQIAGFSVQKDCIYLLRNKGVYEYDMETGDEKLVLENEKYNRLIFEYLDGRLFIFDESISSEWITELITVIE